MVSPLKTKVSPLKRKVSPLKRKRPPHLDIPDLEPTSTDYFSVRDFAQQNDAVVCFGGNGFGVVSRNGKKKFMEDTHRIVPCLVGSSKKVSFFFLLIELVGLRS